MNDETKSPDVMKMDEQDRQREEAKRSDPREKARLAFMDEIEGFDFDKAMKLMAIQEKVAAVGVKNTAIAGLAGTLLEVMNEEAQDLSRRRAKAFKQAEADWARMERDRQQEEAAANAEKEEAEAEARAARPRAIPTGTPAQSTDPRNNPATPAGSATARVADNNARRV